MGYETEDGDTQILRNFAKYCLHERNVPEQSNFQVHRYLPHVLSNVQNVSHILLDFAPVLQYIPLG